MTALCAYCARRPAVVVDSIDGKRVPACRPCVYEDVPDPPEALESSPRADLLRVLRFHAGATFAELCEALGIEKDGDLLAYDRYQTALKRLVQQGAVRAWGGHGRQGAGWGRQYELVSRDDQRPEAMT